MSAQRFEATVRHQAGVAIIDLRGDVNAQAEEALHGAYADAERARPGAILLNFGDVDYINSTGLALIVGLLVQARKAQRRLFACGLNAHYVEIFQMMRLSEFMPVVAAEEQALAAVA